MRLDQKIVNSEFERLRACKYFPSDEVVQDEIKRALNTAPNEIIVSAVVNEWMETQTERPTPADLYRLIRQEVEKGETVRFWQPSDEPKHKCSSCDDVGLAGGTSKQAWRFCECAAGQDRKAREPDAVDKANILLRKLIGSGHSERVIERIASIDGRSKTKEMESVDLKIKDLTENPR